MIRRRRELTPQEAELWSQVARSTKAIRPAPKKQAQSVTPKPAEPQAKPAHAPYSPPPFTLGQTQKTAGSYAPPQPERAANRKVELRMGHKTHKRLTQGKLRPQARIDLHGMTLAIAQPALTSFILSCQGRGLRLVLVITGKGRGDAGPLPTRQGALRFNVPYWLGQLPLSTAVQHFAPAHIRHGGEGAYYVYLRKL